MAHSSFLKRMAKLRKAETKTDPFKTGESFTTLHNKTARDVEHEQLLREQGFPSEQDPNAMRYQRYAEVDSDPDSPDGVTHNQPPWIVNEASEMIYNIPDDDAPSFKHSDKAKSRAGENTMDVKKSGITKRQVKLMKQGVGMEGDTGQGQSGVTTARHSSAPPPNVRPKPVRTTRWTSPETAAPTPTATPAIQPDEINTGSGTVSAGSGLPATSDKVDTANGSPTSVRGRGAGEGTQGISQGIARSGPAAAASSSGTPTQAGFGFNQQGTSPTSTTPIPTAKPADITASDYVTSTSGRDTGAIDTRDVQGPAASSFGAAFPPTLPTNQGSTLNEQVPPPANTSLGQSSYFDRNPLPTKEESDRRGRGQDYISDVGDLASGIGDEWNRAYDEFTPFSDAGAAISDAAGATKRGILGERQSASQENIDAEQARRDRQLKYDALTRAGRRPGSRAALYNESDAAEIGLMEKSLTKRLVKLQKSQGRILEKRGL